MEHIDHEKLNNLVCEVEDRHENGILGANEKENQGNNEERLFSSFIATIQFN